MPRVIVRPIRATTPSLSWHWWAVRPRVLVAMTDLRTAGHRGRHAPAASPVACRCALRAPRLCLSTSTDQYALRTDATQICQMDADLSHNRRCPRLGLMRANAAWSRLIVPCGRVRTGRGRRVLSRFANRTCGDHLASVSRIAPRFVVAREAVEQLPRSNSVDRYAFQVS